MTTSAPTRHAPTRHVGDRRAEVLRTLREADAPLGIADIATRLGVHVNTVRFHLDSLVAAGLVERTRAEVRTPGRPPQLFRATQRMDPAGPRHYRALAEALAVALAADPDPAAQATEAGRAWGRREVAAEAPSTGPADAGETTELLVGMLDDLGFAPDRNTADPADAPPRIGLRSCPFLELALDHAEVVCPVHLGLMQGALDAWGSPVTVDRLDRFVEPDLCVAHLGGVRSS